MEDEAEKVQEELTTYRVPPTESVVASSRETD